MQRRVWLDVARARVRGAGWVLPRWTGSEAARELDGADPSDTIRLWSLSEGDRLHVVGHVTLEADPDAPSFRDHGQVNVFTGDLALGVGRRTDALRHNVLLLIASGLAARAGGLALASRLGR